MCIYIYIYVYTYIYIYTYIGVRRATVPPLLAAPEPKFDEHDIIYAVIINML